MVISASTIKRQMTVLFESNLCQCLTLKIIINDEEKLDFPSTYLVTKGINIKCHWWKFLPFLRRLQISLINCLNVEQFRLIPLYKSKPINVPYGIKGVHGLCRRVFSNEIKGIQFYDNEDKENLLWSKCFKINKYLTKQNNRFSGLVTSNNVDVSMQVIRRSIFLLINKER